MIKGTSIKLNLSESIEELSHGQSVIIAARWVMIVTAFILTIWSPAEVGVLRFQILLILCLAVANFYLHAQTLMSRPVLPQVIYAASAADLFVISMFVLLNGRFESGLFVFYFPAVMAFAVVFPTQITLYYTAGSAILYTVICLGGSRFADSLTDADFQVVIIRVVILAAIAVCSNVYLRIERNRRLQATIARDELLAEIGKRRVTIETSKNDFQPVMNRN